MSLKKDAVTVVVVVEIVLERFFKEGLHFMVFEKQLLTMQSLGDGGLFLWEETRSENGSKNDTGIYNRRKIKRNYIEKDLRLDFGKCNKEMYQNLVIGLWYCEVYLQFP